MQFKKPAMLGLFVLFYASIANIQIFAQESRPRRVAPAGTAAAASAQSNKVTATVQQTKRNAPQNLLIASSAPSAAAPSANVKSSVMQRPATPAKSVLVNEMLVRPTVSARPVAANSAAAASSSGFAAFNQRLLQSMYSRLGIRYVYGSEGPDSYDCSGLVWSVFKEAGVDLERTSAATMWNKFEAPVEEDKYKFGTLVFFNRLGHIGVVIDANTFYQASSSKGVTFSKFAGYWEKRIVGFRRVPLEQLKSFIKPEPAK